MPADREPQAGRSLFVQKPMSLGPPDGTVLDNRGFGHNLGGVEEEVPVLDRLLSGRKQEVKRPIAEPV